MIKHQQTFGRQAQRIELRLNVCEPAAGDVKQ